MSGDESAASNAATRERRGGSVGCQEDQQHSMLAAPYSEDWTTCAALVVKRRASRRNCLSELFIGTVSVRQAKQDNEIKSNLLPSSNNNPQCSETSPRTTHAHIYGIVQSQWLCLCVAFMFCVSIFCLFVLVLIIFLRSYVSVTVTFSMVQLRQIQKKCLHYIFGYI